MKEMQRVLKPSGIFFSALKRTRKSMDDPKFYKEYIAILEKYAGNNFDSTKNYSPRQLLEIFNFKNIAEKTFNVDEYYNIDELLTLVQSLSLWHLVADSQKEEMLNDLKDLYGKYSMKGRTIKREIITILGFK